MASSIITKHCFSGSKSRKMYGKTCSVMSGQLLMVSMIVKNSSVRSSPFSFSSSNLFIIASISRGILRDMATSKTTLSMLFCSSITLIRALIQPAQTFSKSLTLFKSAITKMTKPEMSSLLLPQETRTPGEFFTSITLCAVQLGTSFLPAFYVVLTNDAKSVKRQLKRMTLQRYEFYMKNTPLKMHFFCDVSLLSDWNILQISDNQLNFCISLSNSNAFVTVSTSLTVNCNLSLVSLSAVRFGLLMMYCIICM